MKHWFKNMKISMKLIAGFLIVALLAIAVGVVGITNIITINNSDTQLYQEDTQGLQYAGEAAVEFMQIRYNSLKLINTEDQAAKEQTAADLDKNFSNMDDLLAKCNETILDSESKSILDELQTNWNTYKPAMQKNNEATVSGEKLEVDQAMVDLGATLRDNYTALFQKVSEAAAAKSNANGSTAQGAILVSIIVLAVAVIIAFLLGIILSRSISKPIRHLSDVAQQLSVGDTDIKKTNFESKDEIGQLFTSFRAMIAAIQAMVADTEMLSQAAVEGKLSTRADADNHKGDYRKIVQGVNETLDAVIKPVQEASKVLEEMSRGNLEVSVTGTYQGDHAIIKDSLNTLISQLKRVIGEMSEILGDMSKGNLNVEINSEYHGNFVTLKESINGIIASLNEVLGEIGTAADQVAAGTKQVSDGSQEISQGATEQASAIEELTASVTQIAEQTRQNAMSANKANELTTSAVAEAGRGNDSMKAMQRAMGEISEASSSISKIIKVIDDIAFQTNILALNAAVEAARAGVHGKGFAVVAEEVRNLAARSASAAKETTELIEGSIKKTAAGTKIADETAEALGSIVEGVETAASLVGEIANASNEQASAIAQVNRGIEQMSQVVQTNSATSEEAAAASEELSSQAELLKNMVGQFQLKNGGTYRVKPAALKEPQKSAALGTAKIDLTDSDFGKY